MGKNFEYEGLLVLEMKGRALSGTFLFVLVV